MNKDLFNLQGQGANPTREMNKINDRQFEFLTSYLAKKYGLRIPPEKKSLLESRLFSRIHKLQLKNVDEYINHVFKSTEGKKEYQFFIEYITTHKTFFFREHHQFDFLKEEIEKFAQTGRSRVFRIWSAGCSTGEEVYTLGIILNDLRENYPNIDFKVTGTDISIPSLRKAAKATYTELELANLSEELKLKYFTEQVVDFQKTYKFKNREVAAKLNFGILNLNNSSYNIPHTFDFVFCRNVIIYFDGDTKVKVLKKLIDKIKPDGYLFLGHSESAIGANLPITSIKPTIYQKN